MQTPDADTLADAAPAAAAAVGAARTRPMGLVSIAAAALLLGLLVYMTDRDPARAMLFPAVAALHTGPIFGSVGAWLPSLVHAFAFSLLTAAAMQPAGSTRFAACAAWWAVNVAFETAQHPRLSAPIAETLRQAFGDLAPAQALSRYVLQGGFDVADLLAATAGALAAAGVLCLMHRWGSTHGH